MILVSLVPKKDKMRKRKGNIINGWINLDKPAGMGSTNAVGAIKRLLKPQKAGHAGTLDPLASGILPIALGEATKTIPFAQDHLKTYTFYIRWGEQRSTDDAEGEVVATSDVRPSEKNILAALPAFTGEIEQVPPQFSAIKIDGQRAYDLARDGETPELKARTVFIESIELTETAAGFARFEVVSGKGAYMRSLARDIPLALGTVGYIADLRRTAVGPFTEENAISLDILEKIGESAAPLDEALLPVQTVLDDIPALALNEREAALLKNGQKLAFIARPDMERIQKAGIEIEKRKPVTALAFFQGTPVALTEVEGVEIRPVRILNL